MLKNKQTQAFILVILTTLLVSFSFYFWQVFSSANLNVEGKENVVIYIPEGANYEQVLDTLNSKKLINNAVAFGFITKFMNYRESIKPGRYEIPPNSGNRNIVAKLRAGDQDAVRLTFNNVRTKADLIKKIGNKLNFNNEELLAKLNDSTVCAKYGHTPENIMCMFLPDTYFVYWTVTADEFMERMHVEFEKFWNEERLAKAKSIQMSATQVGIMASIVQSETNKKDEMPRVAGVYVNRIAQGIPLQADPTVKFAVGDFSLKRILTKHLSTESPYNTYKVLGLPPGPIALPERAAIDAVLNYEQHNYVFFCAKEDFSGYHNFAVTLAEHNQNARKYQAALDANGIR